MKDITILIKTFLRKKSLYRLLDSIEKYFLEIKIVIVDDGQENLNEELKKYKGLKINYYKIPYDSGLSFGRNFGLSQIKTKYFLLCDDDFIFTNETNILKLKEILEHEKVDIVGGVIKNRLNYFEGSYRKRLKNFIKYYFNRDTPIHNYYGNILKSENELIVEYFNKSNFDKRIRTDICLNFFLGDTKKILNAGGWNYKLKIGEHTDFFVRMKENHLKVISTKECICDHFPLKEGEYKKFRNRTEEMTKILFESRRIEKMISIFKEKGIKNTYIFDNDRLITKKEKLEE